MIRNQHTSPLVFLCCDFNRSPFTCFAIIINKLAQNSHMSVSKQTSFSFLSLSSKTITVDWKFKHTFENMIVISINISCPYWSCLQTRFQNSGQNLLDWSYCVTETAIISTLTFKSKTKHSPSFFLLLGFFNVLSEYVHAHSSRCPFNLFSLLFKKKCGVTKGEIRKKFVVVSFQFTLQLLLNAPAAVQSFSSLLSLFLSLTFFSLWVTFKCY